MKKQNDFVGELTKLLEKAKIDTKAKYLTAKQVEVVCGRRKYFERKVIDRMFQIGRVS